MAAACWVAPAFAPHAGPLASALGIRSRLERRGVALTFDDGPHPLGTPAVLEVLAEAGSRATFFLVGEQVERHPSLAAEIAAAGHAVALHGFRHRNLLRVTPRAMAEDLRRGAAAIASVTGTQVSHYRPPYGAFSPAALAFARHAGWVPLLWSRWGWDWTLRHGPEDIARRATRQIADGDVILLHDADFYSEQGSWRNTAAALPAILESLRSRGLEPVGVSD